MCAARCGCVFVGSWVVGLLLVFVLVLDGSVWRVWFVFVLKKIVLFERGRRDLFIVFSSFVCKWFYEFYEKVFHFSISMMQISWLGWEDFTIHELLLWFLYWLHIFIILVRKRYMMRGKVVYIKRIRLNILLALCNQFTESHLKLKVKANQKKINAKACAHSLKKNELDTVKITLICIRWSRGYYIVL